MKRRELLGAGAALLSLRLRGLARGRRFTLKNNLKVTACCGLSPNFLGLQSSNLPRVCATACNGLLRLR